MGLHSFSDGLLSIKVCKWVPVNYLLGGYLAVNAEIGIILRDMGPLAKRVTRTIGTFSF